MNHPNRDDLILHYYGEPESALADHLAACEECRGEYHLLQRVLNSVDSLPVPERSSDYEDRMWRTISPKLPRIRKSFWTRFTDLSWKQWAPAAATVALLIGAFVAGRSLRQGTTPLPANPMTAFW